MLCKHCGHENTDDAVRCANCRVLINRIDDAGPTVQMPKPPVWRTPAGVPASADMTRISGDPVDSEKTTIRGDAASAGAISNGTDEESRLAGVLKDRYIIKRRLGKGNMATVYLAHEISLDRDVAIKVLPAQFLHDRQFITRFKREARLAAKLEHPSIVRIFQISDEEEYCYIVMSHIPGGTLTQYLARQGALPLETALLWGMDVTSALSYAHEQGIIHRDLKPDNIMIDKNTRAVVMDFGIARASHDPKMTLSGYIIGTPRYMSPEQATGADADERSDIYTVGLILYEMLTNRLPFEATDIKSYLYHHVNTQPTPPMTYNPDLPGWLSGVILKCLAKKPEERFDSAAALRHELGLHKPGGIPAVVSSGTVRVVPPPTSKESEQPLPWQPMHKYDLDSAMLRHIQAVIAKQPDLPVHARRLIRMVSDDETGSKEVSRVTASDPVLASHILNVVNSSYYGLSRKTSNLHFAIVRLGLNEVRRIVLKHFISDHLDNTWSHEGYTTNGLWYHSYATSVCAEYFAKRYAPKQVGNLVTYGLMHDIGKFSLFDIAVRLRQKGHALPSAPEGQNLPPVQVEEHLFQVNHAIVGGLLAQKWELPERVCDIIEHHHNPSYMDFSSIPADIVQDVTLVSVADMIVHRVTGMAYDLPEPEAEFFELVNLKYPLERNITDELRTTITNALSFVQSMN